MAEFVVGFDLDMTLLDSRDPIAAALAHACELTGHSYSRDELLAGIGEPVRNTLAHFVPADEIEDCARAYVAYYLEHGLDELSLMPGAGEAVSAIESRGGTIVIVSGKPPDLVRRIADRLPFQVERAVGGLFAEAKAPALAELGVDIYVGDHPADMLAARAAGVLAVGVPAGSVTGTELADAGATRVLRDLSHFETWLDSWILQRRLDQLDASLRGLGSVLVAFSGGADSAFLLAAAVRALGPDQVVAATALSPSLPTGEHAAARAFAADLGVRHLSPATYEGARAGYVANSADRCAHCKTELITVLAPLADAALGSDAVVITGTNADDRNDPHRPGIAAAAACGARTPLADAGLSKSQIRAASRAWGLVTWDKPQAACLASRIAPGVPATPTALRRVDDAESAARSALLAAGLRSANLRVRDLGDDQARLEVDEHLVAPVIAEDSVTEAILRAGFRDVIVDPRGFRSGSLNELLPITSRRSTDRKAVGRGSESG